MRRRLSIGACRSIIMSSIRGTSLAAHPTRIPRSGTTFATGRVLSTLRTGSACNWSNGSAGCSDIGSLLRGADGWPSLAAPESNQGASGRMRTRADARARPSVTLDTPSTIRDRRRFAPRLPASAPLALQSERPDQVIDVRPGEIQPACRLDDAPPGLLERVAQQPCLEAPGGLLERQSLAPLRGRRCVGEEVVPLDLHRSLRGSADGGGLDRVGELADVAGPRRRLEGPQPAARHGE